MDTRIILQEQWIPFFNQFSRDHSGWSADVEILDATLGRQPVAQNLPFQGISFDSKGSRACSVDLGFGDSPDKHINHVIDHPSHIRELTESDGSVDLQIEPESGPVTLIHLSGPMH